MTRVVLCVLDSFGIGGAPDADVFGDFGTNTLGSIASFCASGKSDSSGYRKGPLLLPYMSQLGLLKAAELACGRVPELMWTDQPICGLFGAATEVSRGKDTPSGHWEIAGTPVHFDWGYFPKDGPAFPEALIADICRDGQVNGILGNCHASGTDIIRDLGEEHIRTGQPICYTSTDSVFQIAAHEKYFGLDRLLSLCEVVRKHLDRLNIGRVIARPFLGETSSDFKRTANRRDFSVLPPEPTLLDRLVQNGRQVHGIGKIADIYAHQGITRSTKADGNMALFDATLTAIDTAKDGDLVFTNFVDFDMMFGHRRDVSGYAAALEAFDRRLPEIYERLHPGDVLILTADHGCDPTYKGTEHTRERVPVLIYGPGLEAGTIGIRPTFADIGESIASYLGIPNGRHGKPFWNDVTRY